MLERGLPETVTTYGPTPVADGGDGTAYRLLVRVLPQDADGLAARLHAARAERSARKDPDGIRVRMGIADVT